MIGFRRATDGDEWDRLVTAQPGGTAFHRWRWLHAVSRASGWHLIPLIVLEDREAVGVFPVVIRSRLLRISPVLPFPYLGPVVPDRILSDVLKAFRKEQVRRAIPRVLISFSPRSSPAARVAMTRSRYLWRADLTYVVDLRGKSTETIEAGLRADRRKALRKARRNEVAVRPVERGELAALIPQLQSEAFGQRGLTSPYPAEIGTVVQTLIDSGLGIAEAAIVDGEVAGGMVALLDGTSMLNWTAGCLRVYRGSDANTLLHVHMLRRAAAEGYEEFDMVGHVDAGVASFKSSLGAEAREFVSGSTTLLPDVLVHRLSERRAARRSDQTVGTGSEGPSRPLRVRRRDRS